MFRILVMDDDPAVARDIKEILSPYYEVETVSNSSEGLRMVTGKDYHLVLVDIIMPGFHGIDVLREIKASGKKTRVIMMATPLEKLLVEKALQLGADDFVRKPIDVEELMKKVKNHLSEEYEVLVEEEEGRKEEIKPDISESLSLVQRFFLEEKGKTEKEFLDFLLNSLSRIVNAERASVTLIEKETGFLKPIAAKGGEFREDGPFLKVGEGIAGRVALTGEPVLVKNIEKEGLPRSRYGYRYKTSSFICAPVKVRGEVIGVISVNDKVTGESFDEKDLNALLTFSSQVASIIDSILSRIELDRLNVKKKISEKMLSLLLSGMEPDVIYKGIFDLAREVLQCEIMWIVVEEPGTGEFFIEFAGGVEARKVPLKGIYRGLTGKVIFSKTPLRSKEVKEGFSEGELPFAGKVREWMGSPVLLRGRHIGAIFVANKKEGNFTSEDSADLFFLSKFVGLALKEFWLHDNLVKAIEDLTQKEIEIEELKTKLTTIQG